MLLDHRQFDVSQYYEKFSQVISENRNQGNGDEKNFRLERSGKKTSADSLPNVSLYLMLDVLNLVSLS